MIKSMMLKFLRTLLFYATGFFLIAWGYKALRWVVVNVVFKILSILFYPITAPFNFLFGWSRSEKKRQASLTHFKRTMLTTGEAPFVSMVFNEAFFNSSTREKYITVSELLPVLCTSDIKKITKQLKQDKCLIFPEYFYLKYMDNTFVEKVYYVTDGVSGFLVDHQDKWEDFLRKDKLKLDEVVLDVDMGLSLINFMSPLVIKVVQENLIDLSRIKKVMEYYGYSLLVLDILDGKTWVTYFYLGNFKGPYRYLGEYLLEILNNIKDDIPDLDKSSYTINGVTRKFKDPLVLPKEVPNDSEY